MKSYNNYNNNYNTQIYKLNNTNTITKTNTKPDCDTNLNSNSKNFFSFIESEEDFSYTNSQTKSNPKKFFNFTGKKIQKINNEISEIKKTQFDSNTKKNLFNLFSSEINKKTLTFEEKLNQFNSKNTKFSEKNFEKKIKIKNIFKEEILKESASQITPENKEKEEKINFENVKKSEKKNFVEKIKKKIKDFNSFSKGNFVNENCVIKLFEKNFLDFYVDHLSFVKCVKNVEYENDYDYDYDIEDVFFVEKNLVKLNVTFEFLFPSDKCLDEEQKEQKMRRSFHEGEMYFICVENSEKRNYKDKDKDSNFACDYDNKGVELKEIKIYLS